MRKFILTAMLAAITGGTAYSANVTPDVIFGNGNINGGFTVNTGSGVELGLRGKLRFDDTNQPANIFNFAGVDGSGVGQYNFKAGAAPGGFGFDPNSPTTPVWSFEWSINSNFDGTGGVLNSLTYLLSIDGDPSAADNSASGTVFDPVNQPFADHALGTNATGNGGGTKAADATEYGTLLGTQNVAQNSWNYEFFNEPTDGLFLSQLAGFNPNDFGTYRITLSAFDGGGLLASTAIDINVQPVPLPMTAVLLLGGVGAMGLLRRRRLHAA